LKFHPAHVLFTGDGMYPVGHFPILLAPVAVLGRRRTRTKIMRRVNMIMIVFIYIDFEKRYGAEGSFLKGLYRPVLVHKYDLFPRLETRLHLDQELVDGPRLGGIKRAIPMNLFKHRNV